jgi:16S rRNA processing protein RimM
LRTGNPRIKSNDISPNPIVIAKITKTWGLKGELKALPLSEFISCLTPGLAVYLQTSKKIHETKVIETLKKNNKYLIVSFSGITSRESAEQYLNSLICIDPAIVPPLENDVFYHEQIIGLSVCTTEGEMIGKVTDIFQTGSNDVYVVKDKNKEYLVPAIKDVVKKIETENNRIIIKVMQGLLD